MDLQKEREAFEKLPDINAILHNSEFGFNEGINQYYHPNHTEHRLSYAFLMGAWSAWQATKTKAVPDGFVVVPKEPTPKMIETGMGNFDFPLDNGRFSNHDLIFAYSAMIAAAQGKKE